MMVSAPRGDVTGRERQACSQCEDSTHDVTPLRAQCHANADLVRLLRNGVCQDSINSNRGKQKCGDRKIPKRDVLNLTGRRDALPTVRNS